MSELSIVKDTMNERYLGLPVFVGNNKCKVFAYLKENLDPYPGLEGKTPLPSWKGNIDQSGCSGYPNFCNGML